MKEPQELVARLDKWSSWLTAVVVLIPFIVSFGALQELAASNGINYPFMYPLMIDLSLIIFNLVALRSSLHGERNWYAWSLVIAATIISVALNIIHAPHGWLPMFMAALPPLFILAAFHLVVMRIEQSARQGEAIVSLAQLHAAIVAATTEHDQLTATNANLTAQIGTKHDQLTAVTEQLNQAQAELSQVSSALSTNDSIIARRERLLTLMNDTAVTMTQEELAHELGVSVSTIRRDLQTLNGQVSR